MQFLSIAAERTNTSKKCAKLLRKIMDLMKTKTTAEHCRFQLQNYCGNTDK